MKVYVTTTWLEPWPSDECPTYVTSKEPTPTWVTDSLGEWRYVKQNGGMERWFESGDWGYDTQCHEVIEIYESV